jgi:ankyrin repeat protein
MHTPMKAMERNNLVQLKISLMHNWFHLVKKRYYYEIEDFLEQNHLDINMVKPRTDRTALHYAVLRERCREEIVKFLLANDIEVNTVDKDGMPALHYAVMAEDLKLADRSPVSN